MLCAFQVEILVRELDGVLYQALHLASRGLPTLLGDRMANEYIKNSARPLIYFDKDQQEATNSIVLDNGGVVLNLNSEGQGFPDDPPEMQRNFARTIGHVTKICTLGEAQRSILETMVPEDRVADITVTGHPAFDLTAPEFIPFYLRKSITEEHGDDYILINTSFGMFNHEMGFDYYVKMLGNMKEWSVYGDEDHLAHLRRRCAHQERTALAMIELARKISEAHPSRHVIIRPHPAEGTAFYETKLRDCPHVFVIKSGSAREWIASAGGVIHHDCTTGLEALLMGKLVLQFEPYEGIEGSAMLMTKIGLKTTNADDALRHIERGVMPEDMKSELLRQLAPYVANIEGNAASAVADLAEQYADGVETFLPGPLGLWENAKCWRKYASKLLRARQPGRNGRKVRYALNKFSRLTRHEVERRLAGLRKVEPRLPEVAVEQLCLNTFLIRPKG